MERVSETQLRVGENSNNLAVKGLNMHRHVLFVATSVLYYFFITTDIKLTHNLDLIRIPWWQCMLTPRNVFLSVVFLSVVFKTPLGSRTSALPARVYECH